MNDNARGILSVLIACTAFVINDAMVKLASAELPSGEIIFIRGALATVMLSIGVLLLGASRPLSLLTAPMMLVRLASSAASTVFIVISLRHLPLATVNTVLQVTPLAVTAGAAVVFRERVSLPRWAAALTGFLGVALIVRPDAASFGAGASFVLIALLFSTTRDLTTRGLASDIPSIFVAAASAAAISAAGVSVAPFDDAWCWPSERAWVWLTLAAGCLFIATTFLIVALRTGEVSVVAPFRYVPVPLSILLGWWGWNEVPDRIACLGIVLVLAASLYVLTRERLSLTDPKTTIVDRSPTQ
ncbi:MAG TPA: DMT family transporter [Hyphomicrobiaceae bacterium]|nr:DMT family transporter [Hyphomicrobiaceae bacterium]